jgi:hypothetical protein
MPTPFTHLVYAQRLLSDEDIPASARALIADHLPAYYLGTVAADGHFMCALRREDTHFYTYDRPMEDHPWRLMLRRFPALLKPTSADHRAFLAGYVAHLAMDEIWQKQMVHPRFVMQEWGSRRQRFLMLNVLLVTMDERDYPNIDPGIPHHLGKAAPDHWLPFMEDEALSGWGALINRQIADGGQSETLAIIAPRVALPVDALRELLDSHERLEAELWTPIPRSALAAVEAAMYAEARTDLALFLAETQA